MFRQLIIALGLLVFVLGGVSEANGQDNFRTGLRIGYGFATLNGEDVSGAGFHSGLQGSGFARIDFNDNFGVQGELGVSQKGASGDFVISHSEYQSIEITYIEAPFLFVSSTSLARSLDVSLLVGPTIGVRMGDTWTDQQDAVNNLFREEVQQLKADATVALGVQVQDVVLDARYDYGLTKSLLFSDAKSQAISISLGYAF